MSVKQDDRTHIFSSLLDHSTEIIIFLSQDFKILEFNKRAERFYGWQRDAVLGRNFITLCSSYQFDSPIDQCFFARSDYDFEVKSTINSIYAKLQVVSWRIKSNFPAGLSPVAILLMGKNISFKEEANTHHEGNIIAGTPGSLYWKDKMGRYLGCNDYMRRLTHLSSIDEVINKTDYDLWPEQAEQLAQNDQYVMKTGQTLYSEEVVQGPNGKIMLFTSHKMPLRNKDGEIIGVIGNSIDITRLAPPQMKLPPSQNYLSTSDPYYSTRVLLVEDDVLMQKAITAKLKKFHQVVDVVGTGSQAIDRLKRRNYQLVYMDLGLPDLPGYAVTDILRQWEYEQGRDPTPVVALTEKVDEINKAHCLNAGMNFVLQKPLTDELAEKMQVTFLVDRSFITTQYAVRRESTYEKIVDINLGKQLAGGDEAMAHRLLSLLVEELPKNKALIDQAYQEKDFEALSKVISQVHASLCYCGAPRLRKIVETLKLKLESESGCPLEMYDKLSNEINVFLAAYRPSPTVVES